MASHPPHWLMDFANKVAPHVVPFDVLAPVGCHYHLNSELNQWEVSLFVSATQVVGGRQDGSTLPSRFALDVQRVFMLFDEVNDCYWQALPASPEDDLGAHLSIDGVYKDHLVWLRVLAKAPEEMSPGREARPYVNEFRDQW